MPSSKKSFPQKENHLEFIIGGGEMGTLTKTKNWATSKLGSPEKWPLQLKQLIATMLTIPSPMLICWGSDYIQFYNDAFRPILGRDKHPAALGIGADETYAEIWTTIKPMFEGVMQGQPVSFQDFRLMMERSGYPEETFFDFSYSPIRDEEGNIQGIMVICWETTAKVKSLHQLSQSEERFQNLVREATVGIVVLIGSEMKIGIVNSAYGRLIGRTPDQLIGKNLFEIVPEVEGYYLPILEGVRTSGEPIYLYSAPYSVNSPEGTIGGYLNLVYQPYREKDGTITGVIALCQDVTVQVKAQKALEEAEMKLRYAVELAELGTWDFDVATGYVVLSQRHSEWLGLERSVLMEHVLNTIDVADRERVRNELFKTSDFGSDGRYAAEYTAINARTGRETVIHERGEVYFDEQGKPVRITATTRDVTLQRKAQLDLERLVKQRTEQLATAVEELRSANDHLAQSNKKIMSSNAELGQFAYIASHDLQEPLRKISTFATMLEKSTASLDEKQKSYVDRIKVSTSRMTALIRGVLSYSELAKENELFQDVDLNVIVANIRQDYDLAIEQAGAKIICETLPTVKAIPLQMTQLFANLIGNSLKFVNPAVAPVVHIGNGRVTEEEIGNNRLLDKHVPYVKIVVNDNGIGFKEQHAEQIFNIFQRLHRKSEFEGTGIGLAMCRKIALNHHGDINAVGSSERGAQFNILLPVVQ